MTTIATDGQTMAGDGLVISDNLICGWGLAKVFRLRDGRLVGMCGSGYNFADFLKWLEGGGDKPKLISNFEALVLSPDGGCVTYDENCCSFPEELPSACGSGRMLAIGAMAAGKSPTDAVAIACVRDSNSGGVIMALDLVPAVALVEAAA